ncbi:zinc-finger domain-containing protein [Ancylobacter sp.]|uniref:zinc-finger domain-containing protein n=1 Tax=Ancylobacter sp. TaxID=1872567 RepID=UPI003D10CD8A
MAGHVVPHFHNSAGAPKILIAAREFMCVGALPPYDHPHVFLDMGSDDEIVCPYCSTLYKLDSHLHGTESNPPGALLEIPAAA